MSDQPFSGKPDRTDWDAKSPTVTFAATLAEPLGNTMPLGASKDSPLVGVVATGIQSTNAAEPLTQQIVSAMNAGDWPRATRLLIQHLDAVNRSHVIQQAALRWAYDHLADSPTSFRSAVARFLGDKPDNEPEARDE